MRRLHGFSRETRLKMFLHAFPPPKEWMREVEDHKVTHHIVLFLLETDTALVRNPADMSKFYGPFIDELNMRKIAFTAKTAELKIKATNMMLAALMVPKLACDAKVIREIGVKVGMVKA